MPLSESPRMTRRALGWTAAVLVFVAATALLSCIRSRGRTPADWPGPPGAPPIPAFDHIAHLDKGLECADCHQVKPPEKEEGEEGDEEEDGADDGEEAKKEEPFIEPALPTYAACADCHDDEDAEKPDAKKIKNVFFDKAGNPTWASASWEYPPEIRWSHEFHKDLECKTCHGDFKSKERRAGLLFTMNSCIACHREKGGPQGCDDCHPGINTETVPESHRHLWRLRHGKAARTELERAEGRCAYCHTDPFYCERCHKEEKPRSHNNLWRHRSHGVAASIDRASCQVCHQTDFCVRCHSETAPRSHRGQWAHGLNTHCAVCHFPLSSNQDCTVCHQQNPTHSTAPDQPPWHVPGMNCRLCHNAVGGGGAQPLRHFDNGQQCEFCHK